MIVKNAYQTRRPELLRLCKSGAPAQAAGIVRMPAVETAALTDAEEVKGFALDHQTGLVVERAVPKTNLEKRRIRSVVSTESVDREGDIIRQDGWNLDPFVKNPVVLHGHDHHLLPVGMSVGIGTRGKKLVSATEFFDHQMAEDSFQIRVLGGMRAWSVGFQPEEWKFIEPAGIDFISSELWEYSSVTVPANAEALDEVAGLSYGAGERETDLGTQKELAEVLERLERKTTEWLAGKAPGYGPSADLTEELRRTFAKSLSRINITL